MPHILLTIEKGILFDVILARQGLSIVQGIPSNQFLAHTTYHLSKRAHAIIVKDQGVREKGLIFNIQLPSTHYAGTDRSVHCTIPTGRNCSSLHRQPTVYTENELYWLYLAHFCHKELLVVPCKVWYTYMCTSTYDESMVQLYPEVAKDYRKQSQRYRRYNRHVLRI